MNYSRDMTKLVSENASKWTHYRTELPNHNPTNSHMRAQAMPRWKYTTNTDYPSPYFQKISNRHT